MFSRTRQVAKSTAMSWADAEDPVLELAKEELDWFRGRREAARRSHYSIEILLLVISAATTVVAALAAPAAVTACLAAGSLLLNGLRGSFDPQERWISNTVAWLELRYATTRYLLSRSTAKHEEEKDELVEKIEEVSRQEGSRWMRARRLTGKERGSETTPEGVERPSL